MANPNHTVYLIEHVDMHAGPALTADSPKKNQNSQVSINTIMHVYYYYTIGYRNNSCGSPIGNFAARLWQGLVVA